MNSPAEIILHFALFSQRWLIQGRKLRLAPLCNGKLGVRELSGILLPASVDVLDADDEDAAVLMQFSDSVRLPVAPVDPPEDEEERFWKGLIWLFDWPKRLGTGGGTFETVVALVSLLLLLLPLFLLLLPLLLSLLFVAGVVAEEGVESDAGGAAAAVSLQLLLVLFSALLSLLLFVVGFVLILESLLLSVFAGVEGQRCVGPFLSSGFKTKSIRSVIIVKLGSLDWNEKELSLANRSQCLCYLRFMIFLGFWLCRKSLSLVLTSELFISKLLLYQINAYQTVNPSLFCYRST